MAAFRILAFGDSLTEGWCSFGEKFHPYTCKMQSLLQSVFKSRSFHIVNRGVSGETSAQMNARLPVVLDKEGPFDLAIILGGTNDLARSIDKDGEPLFQRLRSLHEIALKHCPVSVAVTIPETGLDESFAVMREKRSKVNELLKNYVQDRGAKMIVSDLSIKLPHNSLSEEDRRKFWDDAAHFSPAGYDRMAEIIFEDIKHHFLNVEES